jgi:hypothetical protein
MKRWLLLENEPALLRADWLPPEEEAPELAELRKEHVRLLALRQKVWDEASANVEKFKAEDDARAEELRLAYREGREPNLGDGTPPEERREVTEAGVARIEAVTDALVEFLTEAIKEVRDRQHELYEKLNAKVAEAVALRAEAQRLLAEADAAVGNTHRMRSWLDRTTGNATIKWHLSWGETSAPAPPEEIDWAEALAGGSSMEVSHA